MVRSYIIQVSSLRFCLFGLFSASSHKKLVRTAKRSRIDRVITIIKIYCFIDHELFRPLHHTLHVILTILRFFSQLDSSYSQILRKVGQKKVEPNRP
jgi:branched-subunit amino acid transport protein AzlD